VKINWERWVRLDKGRFLFAGSMLCIASFAFLYIRCSQPKPQSKDDFKIIKGQLKNTNFINGFRGRRNYTFELNGYSNSFKIKADFLRYFYATDFQQLENSETLTVGISNEDKNNLNSTSDYLFVYLIRSESKIFLDEKDTIAFQNSMTDYYYFSGLFLLGLTLIYFGYKIKTKETTV
jgi:hypothetical protein